MRKQALERKTKKEEDKSAPKKSNEVAAPRTEVANAHASGDGSLKRSDEEQNRFPGLNGKGGGDQY